jgi:hypothetical protein
VLRPHSRSSSLPNLECPEKSESSLFFRAEKPICPCQRNRPDSLKTTVDLKLFSPMKNGAWQARVPRWYVLRENGEAVGALASVKIRDEWSNG